MTIEELAALIQEQTRERLCRKGYSEQAGREQVRAVPGPKYTKIDRGTARAMSGFLMVENATGAIYGIKGYGKVHKGRYYGILAHARQWYWGEYSPQPAADSADGA